MNAVSVCPMMLVSWSVRPSCPDGCSILSHSRRTRLPFVALLWDQIQINQVSGTLIFGGSGVIGLFSIHFWMWGPFLWTFCCWCCFGLVGPHGSMAGLSIAMAPAISWHTATAGNFRPRSVRYHCFSDFGTCKATVRYLSVIGAFRRSRFFQGIGFQ